ncbi:MAG: hypothetical protein IPP51_15320 [Bacteroidetes bacterium]|nr:hypothetical protein [Bacteroidota bacterium]
MKLRIILLLVSAFLGLQQANAKSSGVKGRIHDSKKHRLNLPMSLSSRRATALLLRVR